MERIISPEPPTEVRERDHEGSLRPKWLKEYVGQEKVKEKLGLFIQAARLRNEALDHVLIAGPPGLGKTTLATIIANELGSHIHYVAGPNLDKKGDLAALLTNLEPNDVLFIDEIHRLQKTLEEILYGAMEDYRLDIVIGQGPAAKTLQLDLPKFTLVGATTRSGLLTSPLRDRFGVQLRLDFYPAEELEQIVVRSAKLLGIGVDAQGAREIARRSRGTPRIANRLLKRVRDFAQVKASASQEKVLPITAKLADSALALLEVDHRGLDSLDRKYLLALIEKFEGGAVGVESLASALGEERDTLEEICEPFLIQEGFIQRTSRGRVAMRQSYEHLGLEPKNPTQAEIPSV